MVRKKFHTVYGVNIYPVDYLANEELTENDLKNLFDGKSLIYSLLVAMFKSKYANMKNSDIIKTCRRDGWMDMYTWSKDEFIAFEQIVQRIYKNLYYCQDQTALAYAQNWMTLYGFSIKK